MIWSREFVQQYAWKLKECCQCQIKKNLPQIQEIVAQSRGRGSRVASSSGAWLLSAQQDRASGAWPFQQKGTGQGVLRCSTIHEGFLCTHHGIVPKRANHTWLSWPFHDSVQILEKIHIWTVQHPVVVTAKSLILLFRVYIQHCWSDEQPTDSEKENTEDTTGFLGMFFVCMERPCHVGCKILQTAFIYILKRCGVTLKLANFNANVSMSLCLDKRHGGTWIVSKNICINSSFCHQPFQAVSVWVPILFIHVEGKR